MPETRRLLFAALEAPGNVSRDINRLRRALFAQSGETSALAFPDVVPLAYIACPSHFSPSRVAGVRRALGSCWEGTVGRFETSGVVFAHGSLYLGLAEPVGTLAQNARSLFTELGFEPCEGKPLEEGLGFFICRPADLEAARETATRFAPEALRFLDCSLVLLELCLTEDPFEAQSWKELARSRRRTGPSPLPSGRRRRT